LEEWLFEWKKMHSTQVFGSTLGLFVYFICWVRNLSIFHNLEIPAEVVANLIAKLAYEFKNKMKKIKGRHSIMPDLKERIPWRFFYGACQRHPSLCGVGSSSTFPRNTSSKFVTP